jgi:hypothetical protein
MNCNLLQPKSLSGQNHFEKSSMNRKDLIMKRIEIALKFTRNPLQSHANLSANLLCF